MNSANYTEGDLILVAIIALIASIFITREVFSIPKMIRSQLAQTRALYLIAMKLGVDVNDLRKSDPNYDFLLKKIEEKEAAARAVEDDAKTPPKEHDYDDL